MNSLFEEIPASKINALIDEWIHNAKYREIMRYKLIDAYTYEKTAELVDMSVRQVKSIAYKCRDKIYRHLND